MRESLTHLATCEKLERGVFAPFYKLVSGGSPSFPRYSDLSVEARQRFALFALLPSGDGVTPNAPDGWINLHLLLWKYIIALLVRIDTEDAKFKPKDIWGPAWARFQSKCYALNEGVKATLRLFESRGYDNPPDLKNRGSPMRPIADIVPEGEHAGALEWDKGIEKEIGILAKE